MIYLQAYCVMFVYVFLRAFQQKNTAHSKYLMMIPASYGMAYCDILVGSTIFSVFMGKADFITAGLVMGTAGWNSCMLATYIHNRMHK